MDVPETRYAKTPDGVSIAYHTVGDGPIDLLWLHAFMGGLEVIWEHEVVRSITDKFATFARLIRHDMRATGLSSRATTLPEPGDAGAGCGRRPRRRGLALDGDPRCGTRRAHRIALRRDLSRPDAGARPLGSVRVGRRRVPAERPGSAWPHLGHGGFGRRRDGAGGALDDRRPRVPQVVLQDAAPLRPAGRRGRPAAERDRHRHPSRAPRDPRPDPGLGEELAGPRRRSQGRRDDRRIDVRPAGRRRPRDVRRRARTTWSDAVRDFVGAEAAPAPSHTLLRAVLFTDIVGSTEHLAPGRRQSVARADRGARRSVPTHRSNGTVVAW